MGPGVPRAGSLSPAARIGAPGGDSSRKPLHADVIGRTRYIGAKPFHALLRPQNSGRCPLCSVAAGRPAARLQSMVRGGFGGRWRLLLLGTGRRARFLLRRKEFAAGIPTRGAFEARLRLFRGCRPGAGTRTRVLGLPSPHPHLASGLGRTDGGAPSRRSPGISHPGYGPKSWAEPSVVAPSVPDLIANERR